MRVLRTFARALRALSVSAVCIAATTPSSAQEKGDSKAPPKGAPWQTDFFAARAAALERGVPIFLYSTKTY